MAADRTENLLVKQQRARGDFIVDGTISYVWTAIRWTRDYTSARVPGNRCGVEGGRILDTLPPECSVVAASRYGAARDWTPGVNLFGLPLAVCCVQQLSSQNQCGAAQQAGTLANRQPGRFVFRVGSTLRPCRTVSTATTTEGTTIVSSGGRR